MNRILVVLPNWFGETLFATPFLNSLRRQRPEAFIATLGWPQCREVLLASPHINELIDYDEPRTHRGLWGKWRLSRELRARRFDAAFILRRSLSRSVLLAAAGIRTRVGFANPKSGWLLTHRVPSPKVPTHKALSYLPLLETVGLTVESGPYPYEYVVRDEERRAAREMLRASGAAIDGTPVIVLHPGANWPHKRWAPERFAALGERLAATQQVQIVVTGGPNDAELVASITQRMRQSAMTLAGRTTLRQLAAVLEQAQLVVSNDTGVLHIAAALRRPVVALYGPTSPTLTGPLGDSTRTTVIHHPECCPQIPCFSPERPPHPGMEAITVNEVYEATCQLLAQHAAGRRP
jgi:heptosyltransferase-2